MVGAREATSLSTLMVLNRNMSLRMPDTAGVVARATGGWYQRPPIPPEPVMSLTALLAEGRPLLADGATGTNLFAMGLESGDSPELWNEIHGDRTRLLHQQFVDAGADIILTNTFGANARRLMLHGLEGRVRDLNRLGARNARAVADEAGRPVVVAGSVGPTGDLLAPLGPLTAAEAFACFGAQMEGLAEGGADLAWIETMSAADEMEAAVRAAVAVGLPYTLTASFDTAGRTMMGLSPAAFADLAGRFEAPPVAMGANCGVGASDLLVSIAAMHEAAPDLALIAKANAGIPEWHDGHLHYSGTPDLMADYARLAVDAGARIIGGCCGTSPAHLAAMHAALRAHTRAEAPTRDAIVARLGPLVAPPVPNAEAPRRAKGRRGTANPAD